MYLDYLQIAEIVHDVQRSFCISIGDNSLPTWADASTEMKYTVVDGIMSLVDNPLAGAGFSHEAWMNKKLADGWKLGVVKNWEAKEHPALRPFNELPQHEQTKDYLFVQTVRSLQKFL